MTDLVQHGSAHPVVNQFFKVTHRRRCIRDR